MSDLISGIKSLLENGWRFFTQTDIPGTDISFAVFTVGLALIPIGFLFLSIMLGHSIGEADYSVLDRLHLPATYTAAGSSRYRISPGRQLDVR